MNPTKITWMALVYLGRFGSFQRVTAEKNKKIGRRSTRVGGCARGFSDMPFLSPSRAPVGDFHSAETYTPNLRICREIDSGATSGRGARPSRTDLIQRGEGTSRRMIQLAAQLAPPAGAGLEATSRRLEAPGLSAAISPSNRNRLNPPAGRFPMTVTRAWDRPC